MSQIGYIGGDCTYPRHLIALSTEVTGPKLVSPMLRLKVFTAVPTGGSYKIGTFEPLSVMPPSGTPTPLRTQPSRAIP